MEPLGCIETSVTNKKLRVTSQKNEDVIYMVAEAWRQTSVVDYVSSRNGRMIAEYDEY